MLFFAIKLKNELDIMINNILNNGKDFQTPRFQCI